MAKFVKPPVEDDLLDSQYWQNATNNLNIERQKLSYWIRFVCAIALIIAGFGLAIFSYVFIESMVFPRYEYHPNKPFWLSMGAIWGLFFIASLYFARAGNIFGKITLGALLVIAVGVAGIYIERYGVGYSRIRYMRMDELILLCGLYSTGLLAFPAAYFGWQYAQALKIPQIEEEDWMWKAKTTQLGLKAWRLGALAFIVLGLAWTPIIMDGLEYYKNRLDYGKSTPTLEPVEVEDMIMEDIEEPQEAPWEEDPAPEEEGD